MLKTLTSLLSSRAKNENDSSQLLSIKTLQKAENHPIPPQLVATLQIFPTEFVTHSLRNAFLKDVLVYLKRRSWRAISGTSMTPSCSKILSETRSERTFLS